MILQIFMARSISFFLIAILLSTSFLHAALAFEETRIRCYFSGNNEELSCGNSNNEEESCSGLQYCSFVTREEDFITVFSSLGNSEVFDMREGEYAHFYTHESSDDMSSVESKQGFDQPLLSDLEDAVEFVIDENGDDSQGYLKVDAREIYTLYGIDELSVRMIVRDENDEFVTSSPLTFVSENESANIYIWDTESNYILSPYIYEDFTYTFSLLFDPDSTEWEESSSERVVSFSHTLDLIAPTIAPTPEPTIAPTPEPTIAPTPEPTIAPTPEPTIAPTPEPTIAPTPEPTIAPTPEPTIAPTPEPTIAPTPEPTIAPTPEPTIAPTPEPTIAPTPEPTIAPTPEPTPDIIVIPDFEISNFESNTQLIIDTSNVISVGYVEVSGIQNLLDVYTISELPLRLVVRDSSGGFVASSSLETVAHEESIRMYIWNSEDDFVISSQLYETLTYSFQVVFDPDSSIWDSASSERIVSFQETIISLVPKEE